jgi:hypothetical protein
MFSMSFTVGVTVFLGAASIRRSGFPSTCSSSSFFGINNNGNTFAETLALDEDCSGFTASTRVLATSSAQVPAFGYFTS